MFSPAAPACAVRPGPAAVTGCAVRSGSASMRTLGVVLKTLMMFAALVPFKPLVSFKPLMMAMFKLWMSAESKSEIPGVGILIRILRIGRVSIFGPGRLSVIRRASSQQEEGQPGHKPDKKSLSRYAASEIAERNKVIYWEEGAVADNITQRGFKYIFRTISVASDYGKMAAEFTKDVIAPKLKIDPKKIKVAVMFEDSLYGTTVGNSAVKWVKQLGMDLVASESYSAKTVDLSSIVMIFKSKKPDVIIATSYMEDSILFWRQAKDMDLNVKAFIGTGAGHGMPEWAKTFGNEANYIFNIDPPVGFNPKIFTGNTQALLNDFRERFNKKFGHYPATHATAGFVSARLLFNDVLPKAGSDDPEAVRKAALAIDIPEGGTVFGYGVKFAPPGHPMAGQDLRAHPNLMQWQNQKMTVVYPAAFAVGQPLLPLPTWEERAKGVTKFVK